MAAPPPEVDHQAQGVFHAPQLVEAEEVPDLLGQRAGVDRADQFAQDTRVGSPPTSTCGWKLAGLLPAGERDRRVAIATGTFHPMRVTIDAAGRIVIPKALRDRLALRGGEELEVRALADRLEIRRAGTDQPLVQTHGGLRTMASGPGLDPDQVREMLERERR